MKIDLKDTDVTREGIMKIFSNNSLSDIKECCTDSSIQIMYSKLIGGTSTDVVAMLQEISHHMERISINNVLIQMTGNPSEQSEQSKDVQQNLKLLDSITVLENVEVKLYELDAESLQFNIEVNGKTVHIGSKSKRSEETKYLVDDLGSGRSDSGATYLSLAVCEDSTMYYFYITATIDRSGKVTECEVDSWSDSETGSYYVYDESAQDLVLFTPRTM